MQVLLECEHDEGHSNQAGSILDNLTSGLVGQQGMCIDSQVNEQSTQPSFVFVASSSPPEPKADDFFPSLFRDTTGSHLAQAILITASANIFEILWRLHFVGKIGKLSTHPIANFVVSTGVRRATEKQMQRVIDELKAVDPSTLIRESKVYSRLISVCKANVYSQVLQRHPSYKH